MRHSNEFLTETLGEAEFISLWYMWAMEATELEYGVCVVALEISFFHVLCIAHYFYI
jgi:hypothetical protein